MYIDIPNINTLSQNGGLFGFGEGKNNLENVIKRTKSSESDLINAYEAMDARIQIYNKAYEKHLENLLLIDDFIHFNGMETLFKKVIMKDNFTNGKIDRSNPLLFQNYLIEGDISPSSFRKEHLIRQINYFLNRYFAGYEHLYIKYIDISDITKTSFLLQTTTINNKTQENKIEHTNFLVDKNEIKEALYDILSEAKKNIKGTNAIAKSRRIRTSNNNNNNIINSINNSRTETHTRATKKTQRKSTISGKKRKSTKKTANTTTKQDMLKVSLESVKLPSNLDLKKEGEIEPKILEIKPVVKPARKKLSMFMTNAEKRAEKGETDPFATGALTSALPQGVLNKAQGLLTGDTYAQPLVASNDPQELKCRAIAGDFDICKNNGCAFDSRTRTCKMYPPKPAEVFAAPPGFGAPPAPLVSLM